MLDNFEIDPKYIEQTLEEMDAVGALHHPLAGKIYLRLLELNPQAAFVEKQQTLIEEAEKEAIKLVNSTELSAEDIMDFLAKCKNIICNPRTLKELEGKKIGFELESFLKNSPTLPPPYGIDTYDQLITFNKDTNLECRLDEKSIKFGYPWIRILIALTSWGNDWNAPKVGSSHLHLGIEDFPNKPDLPFTTARSITMRDYPTHEISNKSPILPTNNNPAETINFLSLYGLLGMHNFSQREFGELSRGIKDPQVRTAVALVEKFLPQKDKKEPDLALIDLLLQIGICFNYGLEPYIGEIDETELDSYERENPAKNIDISKIIGMLGDNNSDVRETALRALIEYIKHENLAEKFDISKIIGMLADADDDWNVWNVRRMALLALTAYIKHEKLAKEFDISMITNILGDNKWKIIGDNKWDNKWKVRRAALLALTEYIKHEKLAKEFDISMIIGMLGDNNSKVREAALLALAKYVDLQNVPQTSPEWDKIQKAVEEKMISSDDLTLEQILSIVAMFPDNVREVIMQSYFRKIKEKG